MAKKRVFVSFDYTDNHQYKDLLAAWNRNPRIDFEFINQTPDEIQSERIDRIKAVLTTQIRKSTHSLVIVGENATKRHPDWREIGYHNWIYFEIAKSKENGKKLAAIKLKRHYNTPSDLYNSGVGWAYSFTLDAINKALDEAQ